MTLIDVMGFILIMVFIIFITLLAVLGVAALVIAINSLFKFGWGSRID